MDEKTAINPEMLLQNVTKVTLLINLLIKLIKVGWFIEEQLSKVLQPFHYTL